VLIDLHINQSLVDHRKILELATAIDNGPFTTLWLLDHFAPLHGDTGHPMLEPFSLLGALTTRTKHLTLGILVANVVNRRPAIIAQGATSLQYLSNNRFALGLGAGASPQSPFANEHRSLGIELKSKMADRHDDLSHAVNEIRNIWRHNIDGDIHMVPPQVEPPITIGVNSPELAVIAGKLQCSINVRWDDERLAEGIAAYVLEARTIEQGPAPHVSVWMPWSSKHATSPPDFEPLIELGVGKVIYLTTEASHFDEITATGLRL